MRLAPLTPRRPDWPERLAALIEERRRAPFRWGAQDCCLLAADAVVAMTGEDPATAWRGRYTSEVEAEALLGPAGGLEAMVAAALAEFGAAECSPAFAQRGDVALVLAGNQPTMGVVLGDVVAAPGPEGLTFLPPAAIQRAWSI